MDDDRWDERHEPTGWGERAYGGLLDAVTEGLDALVAFAVTDAGAFEATASAIADLLAEAEGELSYVDSPDRRREAQDAVRDIRRQLALTVAAA